MFLGQNNNCHMFVGEGDIENDCTNAKFFLHPHLYYCLPLIRKFELEIAASWL
ncbi:uncharacterized protein BDW70DRAFT_165416 [Aspergillus foveolatus]|uniref:uncharacterized protein n=1 Tax=Aspergillus foveolatus TaxID=210207 RepID=UPI003CCD3311